MDEDRVTPTIDEVYKLVKENNRMLKAIRRDAFIGGIVKAVFWVVVVVILPYLFYVTYLEPYVQQMTAAYTETQGDIDSFKAKLEGLPDFQKLLEQFGGKAPQ